ncbi:hypothetical protein [Haliangium sp.]|uniref:hypothetical protein n=1 Tax=Haliangium sp. TaxID=2663208 RepID=UPI003D0FAD17
MSNVIEKAGWKVHWKLTESSGLMVYLVDFQGTRVLWEASLPYVTIDHQRSDLAAMSLEPVESEDEVAAAEAAVPHGPFWVPLGQRTLVGGVRINELRRGFELVADFAAGPYRYTQMWRFHDDGRIGPWLTIYGTSLHEAHTYHPHWRFDFDVNGAKNDAIERFEDGHWTRVAEEGWFPYTGEQDQEGNVWRQVDFDSGAAVSIRPHSREDAELFAIRYRDGEWTPPSPRNDADAQPFPAAYVGSEPLDGHDVMLWYVAHVHYNESFPFTAGPWVRVSGA